VRAVRQTVYRLGALVPVAVGRPHHGRPLIARSRNRGVCMFMPVYGEQKKCQASNNDNDESSRKSAD
jgi:hypothetical protein